MAVMKLRSTNQVGIRQVAKAAGVSVASVSRTLRTPEAVQQQSLVPGADHGVNRVA